LEVEHLLPRFKGGSDAEENLWLACRLCNGYKAAQTHTVDPVSGESVDLFNPRDQSWNVHFKWSDSGTHILGLTPAGRATVIALQLNNSISLMVRREWVSAGWHPPAPNSVAAEAMKNQSEIRKRFLSDEVPVRLGGARLESGAFSSSPSHHDAVMDLTEESKFFIEWTAIETEVDVQADLVRIQVDLARWQIRANQDRENESTRLNLASAAKGWSDSVLQMSGLLNDS